MFIQERLEEIKWELDSFLEHPSALQSGTLLCDSKYEIIKLEEITERTFVYKGLKISTGDFVSIKEFFPKESIGIEEQLYFSRDFETNAVLIQDSTTVKREQFKLLLDGYIEEAKYIEKLAIGNPIVKILDAFEDFQTVYIVTSYNQWPSLEDLMKQGYTFTQDELDMISKQLLNIVSRFHKRGIIHRNVNPSNIYIRPDEIVVDSLGASDFLQEDKYSDSMQKDNKYCAPEVMISPENIGTWSDVYAIGKVMIEIICRMTESGDYFRGLEEIESDKKALYSEAIKSAIYFEHTSRIQTANELKEKLYPASDVKRYKTPPSMVMLITFITLVSSFLVIWQYNSNTLMSNNEFIFEEEDLPLGAPTNQLPIFFITHEMEIVHEKDSFEIRWAKKEEVMMLDYKVLSLDHDVMLQGELNIDATSIMIETKGFERGVYQFIAYYVENDKKNSIILEFEIE